MNLRSIAFSNLRRRKGRTAFLVAGLLIGVAAVVALLAVTQTMTSRVQADLESFGATIVVLPRSEDVGVGAGEVEAGGVTVGARALRDADVDLLEAIPARDDLATVAPALVAPVRAEGRRVLLMGARIDDELELKRWWSVGAGRPPQSGRELMVGAEAARLLGLRMGSPLRVAGRRFIVTGVLRPTGSDDDRLLIAELRAVQRLLGRPGELTLVEVAARPGASVTRLTGQLAAALPSARVVSLREAVQSRLHAVDQFRGFAYAIVAVILGIEGLVVFLTMSGAVAERTHEIGVFRALGFRSAHVTRLIVLEAAVAGLLAGVLGAAAGVLVAWLVLPAVSDGAQMTWSPLPGLAAVVASVLLGSAASLPPALRAGRLDPTEALRAL